MDLLTSWLFSIDLVPEYFQYFGGLMKFRIFGGRISVVCECLWSLVILDSLRIDGFGSMDYFDNSKVVLCIYRVLFFLMKLTVERVSMTRGQFLKPVNPLKVL